MFMEPQGLVRKPERFQDATTYIALVLVARVDACFSQKRARKTKTRYLVPCCGELFVLGSNFQHKNHSDQCSS